MKKLSISFLKWRMLLVTILAVTVIACSSDDEGTPVQPLPPMFTGNSEEYSLFSKSDPGISGMATFAERDDGVTVITIELTGTSAGNHPAHIHGNTAAEGGGILIDLTNVDGTTGMSVSEISAETYSNLINFDGYINVHLSTDDLATLIAQGDIGQNELTGISEDYPINAKTNPNISGEAVFSERVNGETLVVVTLEGTDAAGDHPMHIHANTAAEGGGILVSLTNVNGETGISATNVAALNDDTPITYAELIDFNGYINVHLSSDDLGTLIGQGDIGQNALTGNSVEYPLNSKSDPNISGTATFAQRENGSTLITVQLQGTSEGGDHPTHIHENDAATGGGILISLSNVNGATGIGATSVTMLNDETAITYDELIIFNGYINVHLSDMDLGTLIAQGDIGSNAD